MKAKNKNEDVISRQMIKILRNLQNEFEDSDKEFARTMGRAKDAIRIKFKIK